MIVRDLDWGRVTWRMSQKASLSLHLSKEDLGEASGPGRQCSKCKGPEAGTSLASLKIWDVVSTGD
jgi:hypothetical protein